MADHRALQRHAYASGERERHRQRHQRVEGEPLRGKLCHRLLHHPGGVGAKHQHLAVGHIDHSQQAVGDRQSERGQQQNGAQRQAHKRLAQQVADGLTVLDLAQAFCGGFPHPGVRLGLRMGIRQQSGLHLRIARLAQQRDGLLAYRGLGAGQLETGDGQAQHLTHRVIILACQLTL
ncbi:hypothetical protein D3C76_1205080 [compost metagenome]